METRGNCSPNPKSLVPDRESRGRREEVAEGEEEARIGKMQKTMHKQRGEDIGCVSNKKQNASITIPAQRSIHSDITFEDGSGNCVKSCGSSLSELTKQIESKLSESVVSVALFIGDTMLFECTGILIENLCADATSVLTEASIVGSSDFQTIDDLTIKVRLPNRRVFIGWLHHWDFNYGIAVVNIRHTRGFQEAHLSSSHCVKFESTSNVVAVGRCFDSGKLKSINGMVIGSASDEFYELTLSTSKINTAWIGCPLVNFDGHFVGMSLSLQNGERTALVPMNKILECLGYSGTARVGINQGGDATKEASTTKTQNTVVPKSIIEEYVESSKLNCSARFFDDVSRMHVMYSFEEEFEDNIWSMLNKNVASTLSECVVSLASFNGKTRCFVCTGVFISCSPVRILTSASLVRISGDGNKIDDNLQIQVYLNNKNVRGMLKHYDLRYNVAVIEVIGSCSPRAMELEKHISFTRGIEVVAVGCLFEHQKLMASRGVLINGESKLNCKDLKLSTCSITKAGIGGPLIDIRGNFVGMNFFHTEETPYLPRKKIQELLAYSDEQWQSAADAKDRGGSNRWPVPSPHYYYPPFCVHEEVGYFSDEEPTWQQLSNRSACY